MTATVSPAGIALRRRAIAVELERRRRRRAAPQVTASYGEWLRETDRDWSWDYRHFRIMQEALDRITGGTLLRLYVQIPIRHGKSEHNTIRYAAYRILRDPQTRALVASYNQRQANTFSRAIRRNLTSHGVEVSGGVEQWETAAGGGVRAVGAGTGVASVNADLILIDDPIGSRDASESQSNRDSIWDWLTSDILARAEPHTAVIMTMSRWHQDDPGGRIRDRFGEQWEYIDLPGEAEEGDPLGRESGEPLWPEHRGIEWLTQKKIELLEYGFASLIQGRPRPREGGMFQWSWWGKIDVVPAAGQMIRYWDLAGTKPKGDGHDPDYTAGALMVRTPEKQTVIAHVKKFRVAVAERDALIEAQAKKDLAGYGRRVTYWLERQAGISGEEATSGLLRRLQSLGIAAYAESVTGSKAERATPLASAAMAGNVLLGPDDSEEPWHDGFRLEAADFPTGSHDDQIDAASGAFNKLDGVAVRGASTFANPFG